MVHGKQRAGTVNRRQRPIDGIREPFTAAEIGQAIVCPDCDADVTMTEVAPGLYQGEVTHSATCPWYANFRRNGGLGMRFQ